MKKTIVLKMGGSVLGSLGEMNEALPWIIETIQKYQKEKYNVAIVVSAPKGMTRDLNEFALPFQNPQLQDSVLSQGERLSTSLITAGLNANDVPTTAFNCLSPHGKANPIKAKGDWGQGEITEIKTDDIKEVFANNHVAVIPGFYALNENGEPITLGFDGSDTSAVALAGALNATCVLYKDVSGVFTANPKRVPAAQLIEHISYADMRTFAENGAAIIHPNAVRWAEKHGIEIQIQMKGDERFQTKIGTKNTSVDGGITYRPLGKSIEIKSIFFNGGNIQDLKIKGGGTMTDNIFTISIPCNGCDLSKIGLDKKLTTIHTQMGLDDPTYRPIGLGQKLTRALDPVFALLKKQGNQR